MKKILKIAAITVTVVLVVVLFAPMLLRGKVAQVVRNEANAMLTARLDFEKLDISLLRRFPNASLEIKGLTLIGRERFEGDTIVAAKRISVVVDPWSLFGEGGFEVRKVLLVQPRVHGHKLADGAVNYDVMKPSDEQPAAQSAAGEEPSSFRLSIRDFRISDALIRYEDDSTSMHLAVGPASLRLNGDLSAEKSGLKLRLKAHGMNFSQGGVPLLSDAEAEFDAAIDADLKNGLYTFSHNTLRLNAISLSLDGWVRTEQDALSMDLRAGSEKVQFKDVLSLVPVFYTREFRNLTASGELSLSLWARGEMRGATLPAFELKTEVRDGSFQYSSLPGAVTDINIAASVSNPGGTMDRTVVDLSKFGLKMAGNSVAATLYATDLMSDPLLRATASGRIDLSDVKSVYPLEKGVELGGVIAADLKVSGRMSAVEKNRYEKIGASGTFVIEGLGLSVSDLPRVFIRRAAATVTPRHMTLGEFGLTVGRSDLAANGQLSGYLGYLLRGETLTGRLYVKSDLLDLNEIMDAVASPETPAAASKTPSEPLQVIEVPRNLNLSLNTELQKILFAKMTVTGLTGEMRTSDGVLLLERLRLGIFGGKATASGRYSTAVEGELPQLNLAASLSGASFAKTFEELEMVQKLVPVFAKTGGDYSMTIDLATTLDKEMSPDLQTLTATGELSSKNIRVENLEAFDALAKALDNDALRRIEAKDVTIRFSVKEGRIATQPFDLKLGGADIRLSGTTGLDQSIDYTARVALPAGMTGGLLESIDVGIGGTFSAPKITLGMKQAAEQAVKQVIDEQLQKLTGSNSLSEEVQKQAEKLRQEAVRAGEKLVEAAESQRAKLIEGAAGKGKLAQLAAEKAGDKLVSEAKKQADKLTAEAEKQIEKITSSQQ